MRKYILYALIFVIWINFFQPLFADIVNIPYASDIEKVSVEYKWGSNGSIVDTVNGVGFSILNTLKIILSWVLLIFLVYVWVQMIISLWEDGEDLSAAKRQLAYILVALVFINIPGTLYEAFYRTDPNTIWGLAGTWSDQWVSNNVFFNSQALLSTINSLVGFMQMLIFGVAIIMIILSGIRLILAGSDEEQRKNSTQKVIWSVIALIFVWFIEMWKQVAFTGRVSGENSIGGLFGSIIDIALYFAAPIALVFLTLAGFYYITSNGDEERVKKAKNIVIYTVVATVLLLSIFTFLLDLAKLF